MSTVTACPSSSHRSPARHLLDHSPWVKLLPPRVGPAAAAARTGRLVDLARELDAAQGQPHLEPEVALEVLDDRVRMACRDSIAATSAPLRDPSGDCCTIRMFPANFCFHINDLALMPGKQIEDPQ